MPCVNSTARLSLKPSRMMPMAQQLVGNQASGVLDARLAGHHWNRRRHCGSGNWMIIPMSSAMMSARTG